MKRVCRSLQRTLAEHGPAALRADEAAQRHLEECDACFAVLESLTELDAAFAALPSVDAPDEVVESLLVRVERDPPDEAPAAGARRLQGALAGGLRRLFGPGHLRLKAAVALVLLGALGLPFYLRSPSAPESFVNVRVVSGERQDVAAVAPAGQRQYVVSRARLQPLQEGPAAEELRALGSVGDKIAVDDFGLPTPDPNEAVPAPEASRYGTAGEGPVAEESGVLGEDLPWWVGTRADVTFRGGSPRIEPAGTGPFDADAEERERVRERLRERLRRLPRGLQEAAEKPEAAGVSPTAGESFSDRSEAAGELEPRQLARRFLAARDALDVPRFLPAAGYWTNTYVPGDPVLRYLQARLAESDRSTLWSLAEGPLHEAARRTTQPFDPPSDAALAVYLHADRAAVEGESRMLVQVGLAATERRGGRRPAMNVAVVLDLSAGVAPETAAALRALVAAFGEARDVGDRFRLVVAGPGGGELLRPEEFRHGPLTVAMERLFAGPAPEGEGVSLVGAVRTAVLAVGKSDDPASPLGSSAVLVATPRPLGDDLEALEELAWAGAVAGVPVSAVGVGDGAVLGELERLALAGQGSRRLLREPAEARALVDRELSAASRAVARAVRLRIGLEPGVRLVGVVGARRLGEVGAEKVRRLERSLDLRLAHDLGIAADRGGDEPGLQIVIPTFYAGDRHAVLLDVVAPGPGPVADVTVRFKDLVHLENGVARARLDLPRGEPARGPLERNVLENLLAHELRGVLESAGRDVVAGDRERARSRLVAHRRLLAGLGLELPGFDKDADLGRDVAMLDAYARLLASEETEAPGLRYLSRSLRYAARLKVLPPPMEALR